MVAASIAAAIVLLGGGLAIALVDSSADPADSAATSTAISTPSTAPASTVASSAPTTDATTASTEASATTEQATTTTASTDSSTTTATTIPTTETTMTPTTIATAAATPTTSAAPRILLPPITPPATTPPPTQPAQTDPPTTTPPPAPPGQLTIPNGVIDLGTSATSGEFSVINTGGQTITWSVDGSANPFGLSATSGQLEPGQTTVVQVILDRGATPEGAQVRDLSVASSSGAGAAIELLAVVEHAPTIVITHAAKTPVCPQFEVETIVASVTDESALKSVVLSWSGPGKPGSTPMQFDGSWSAQLGVPYVDGTWTYTITATDGRGNTNTAQASTEVLCPTPR